MSDKNAGWHKRLNDIMPWGSGTCSKAAIYHPDEPAVITRGKGCRVWDADGREYIDFRNGLGPVTLGHAYPEVNAAITEQLEKGIIFGHPAPLECEIAEIICRTIPSAQKARFLKTGGEACAACVKIARAYTGRDRIIQVGYNGWLNGIARDSRILPGQSIAGSPKGVPDAVSGLFHACGWNDMEKISQLFDEYKGQIAAVMIACDYADIEKGHAFYPFLRKITKENDALLICDEIVMGMRIAYGGAHEYFGFTPDLFVLSKGIANGMPLSVYAGRAEVMNVCDRAGGAVISSTFAGELLSLAAAKACFEIYRRENVIGHLWRQGKRMKDGLNGIFNRKGLSVEVKSLDPVTAFVFGNHSLAEPFYRAAYRNGVALYGISYVNFSHKEDDINEAIDRINRACEEI